MDQTLTKELTIFAFPRLHISLIGMNNSGYRINGGIGFSIGAPKITARITRSNSFDFQDNRLNAFSFEQCKRLKQAIEHTQTVKSLRYNISVKIDGDLYTHSGLGSGTIIRLICLEAIHILNERNYNEQTLVELSGRGGTSGVGIRTYFHGGFVFDIGHRNIKQELLPSSTIEFQRKQTLLVENGEMPIWEIGLCFPKSTHSLSEIEEIQFFKKVVPISESAVFETLYHVTYGVYGSIREMDKPNFELAVNNIQHLVWKTAERSLYGIHIREFETALFNSGASCVGMSSLGPCLFFTADSVDNVIKEMQRRNTKCSLIKTVPVNNGRIIIS